MAFTPIGVTLQIAGQVNSSLGRSFSYATMGLRKLQTQAMVTTTALSRIGTGLFGIAAFGGGFAALAGITSFMSEAVRLGKQQENVTMSLNTLLISNLRIRHQSAALAADELKAIQDQSHALQEHSGIFQQIYTKGAAILATAHLSANQIMRLQPAMGNLMAYRRTMGDAPETLTKNAYEAITKAIYSGQARGMNQMGVQISPLDRRMMVANATTHNIEGNIKIIMRYLNIFKGEAAKYFQSLPGQVDLATAHIQEKMSTIGKAFQPIQQQLILLADKFVTLITPATLVAFRYVNRWLIDLNALVQAHMPQFKQWIEQGWVKLVQTIYWFKQNSYWLIPVLRSVVIGFVAWKVATLALNSVLFPLLGFVSTLIEGAVALGASLGPEGLAGFAIALAAGGTLVHDKWDMVLSVFRQIGKAVIGYQLTDKIGEKIFGTEAWRKANPEKRDDPRSRIWIDNRPQQFGWIPTVAKMWNDFIDSMPASTHKAWQNIQRQWSNLVNFIILDWKNNVDPNLIPTWNKIIDLMGTVRGIYLDIGLHAFQIVIQGASNFLDAVVGIRDAFRGAYEWLSKLQGDNKFEQIMEKVKEVTVEWFTQIKNWFQNDFPPLWVKIGTEANKVFGEGSTLANWSESIRVWEETNFPIWGAAIATWFQGIWTSLVTWMVPNVWNAMVSGVKGVGDAIKQFLVDPITSVKTLWDQFLASLQPHPMYPTRPGDPIPGRVPGPTKTGGGYVGGDAALLGGKQRVWSPMDSMWGRKDSHGTMYTHFGYPSDETWDSASGRGEGAHVKAMIPLYDVALNNDEIALLRKMGINPERGKEFKYDGVRYRYGDQIPEYFRGRKVQGARMDIFDPSYGPDYKGRPRVRERAIPAEGVTIINNNTYHIHGHENVEHRMATIQHGHLERMKKDLEEASYSVHRRSFA